MDIAELRRRAAMYAGHLAEVKASCPPPPVGWYPPMLPWHVDQLDQLLTGEYRALLEHPSGKPIADIGAADGDFGFFLASEGFDVDLYDGADRPLLLKAALHSPAGVHFVHLDHDFVLPRKYEIAFLLHVLYHLRNPMLALDTLAQQAQFCILSTRVASYVSPRRRWWIRRSFASVPVAYLLDPYELNSTDPANYWIFSPSGLLRLLDRCGWDVLNHVVVGDSTATVRDPGQGRMWCLMRSRQFSWDET